MDSIVSKGGERVMADDQGMGRNDDLKGQSEAGSQSSGNTGNTEEHTKSGQKGGKAAQQGDNTDQLTDDEKTKGGQMSSDNQDMNDLGTKGKSR
jgi:hypothetical protein